MGPPALERLSEYAALKQRGLVTAFGVEDYSDAQIQEAHAAFGVATVQQEINLLSHPSPQVSAPPTPLPRPRCSPSAASKPPPPSPRAFPLSLLTLPPPPHPSPHSSPCLAFPPLPPRIRRFSSVRKLAASLSVTGHCWAVWLRTRILALHGQ